MTTVLVSLAALGLGFTQGFTGAASAMNPKDIRGTELCIRAGSMPILAETTEAPLQQSGGRSWPRLGSLLALVLLLAAAILLGAWVHGRQRRRARTMGPAAVPTSGGQEQAEGRDQQSSSDTPSPPLAAQCSACGQKLKARPDLAGKKVKCPQCGQGVLLPETNLGSLAPPASTGRFSILKKRWAVASVLALAVVAGVCCWLFWPWRDKYSFLNAPLGNQAVPDVQESGFYYQEYDQAGNPFRWTNGKARLVIPIDRRKPPTGLVLKLEIYRPARVKAALVQVVANNRELIKQQVSLGDWQGSSSGRFPARSLDLTGIDLGDELVLDIISDTFFAKTDGRTLGVLVRGVELLHEAPAPQ